jgi:hypothetical protein
MVSKRHLFCDLGAIPVFFYLPDPSFREVCAVLLWKSR